MNGPSDTPIAVVLVGVALLVVLIAEFGISVIPVILLVSLLVLVSRVTGIIGPASKL